LSILLLTSDKIECHPNTLTCLAQVLIDIGAQYYNENCQNHVPMRV
jgi:hypothetical protein